MSHEPCTGMFRMAVCDMAKAFRNKTILWFCGLIAGAGVASLHAQSAPGGAPRPDYATLPVETLRASAIAGDPHAEFYYGARLASDKNTPMLEAVRWFRKSAEHGYALAQFSLGVIYEAGEGVQKNPEEAARWYEAAAKQGMGKAQFNLGILYEKGSGVPLNYEKAAGWYKLAAERGVDRAQYNLGCMYREGRGVAMDVVEAYKWLRAAESLGNETASKALKIIQAGMTDEQRKDGARRAAELIRNKQWGSKNPGAAPD